MKRSIFTALFIAVLSLTTTFVFASEYGAEDYSGETVVATQNDSSVTNESTDSTCSVKCFYRWRYYRSYYYTPVYYYYTPCYTYYTPVYCYRTTYVTFYKSMNVKSRTNNSGVLINETPKAGTPLATQNIVAGDVITHIDGKEVTSPKQLENITAKSNLVVLKVNGSKNPEGLLAPVAPEVEYGSFEY